MGDVHVELLSGGRSDKIALFLNLLKGTLGIEFKNIGSTLADAINRLLKKSALA